MCIQQYETHLCTNMYLCIFIYNKEPGTSKWGQMLKSITNIFYFIGASSRLSYQPPVCVNRKSNSMVCEAQQDDCEPTRDLANSIFVPSTVNSQVIHCTHNARIIFHPSLSHVMSARSVGAWNKTSTSPCAGLLRPLTMHPAHCPTSPWSLFGPITELICNTASPTSENLSLGYELHET